MTHAAHDHARKPQRTSHQSPLLFMKTSMLVTATLPTCDRKDYAVEYSLIVYRQIVD